MATQTQTAPKPAPQVPAPVSGGKAGNYIFEVRKEMRKVSWPKREELLGNTVATLVVALVLSLLIFGADQIISWVLAQVYG